MKPATSIRLFPVAGWSSLVARRAHNPKAVGSNPTPATNKADSNESAFFLLFFPFIYIS
jgi:hypothetical protein